MDSGRGCLADALGMSLEFVAREEKAGPYSADILCRDPNDQTKVVVENQLGQTDHDHLGKLLTYAAHFNARVLVWVARTFTDQHRAALDWLNEVSETSTRFFGLEIELWQIGDSVPAPKFNVVARPNDWTKDGVDAAALTDTQRMQLGFWEGFAEFVSRKGTIVKKTHAPRPHNWLGMVGVGRGGFYWRLETDFGDPDQRTEQYRWLLERVEALHLILAPRVRALPLPG